MNFTTKIFLSIMFVATVASIIVAGSLYSIFKKDIELEFANRYLSYGDTIGSIFHYLEIASDLANKNAVLLLSDIEASRGIPSDKELDLLAKKFGVNSFYIINKSGKFIRSSDLPIKQQINSFFSYSKEYRSLVSGNRKIAFTPIIPGYPYDIPAKFAMIPNHDKTLILESSTHLEYIGKILHQIIMTDKNIRSVGLYAPTGYELGSISSSGKFNQGRRNAINDFSLSNKATNEAFIFSIKIPSLTENCPECVQKGVSLDKKYYYILRLEVSIFPLLTRLNLLKTEIIFVFTIILIIGIVLSRTISKKLVNRIEKINLTASNIIESQNMDLRVLINGNDEIARLATTFNKMIEVLKESQKSIVETEKMCSMAKISAQLAHDIRSPLAAMEIMLKSIAKDQPEKFYIMLREAIQGVRDIANNYLINYRHVPESKNSHVYSPVNSPDDGNVPRPLLLSSLVESVISQKRLEYVDCEIDFIKKSFENKTPCNLNPEFFEDDWLSKQLDFYLASVCMVFIQGIRQNHETHTLILPKSNIGLLLKILSELVKQYNHVEFNPDILTRTDKQLKIISRDCFVKKHQSLGFFNSHQSEQLIQTLEKCDDILESEKHIQNYLEDQTPKEKNTVDLLVKHHFINQNKSNELIGQKERFEILTNDCSEEIRKNKNDFAKYYQRACLYQHQENMIEAYKDYIKAIELNPDFRPACDGFEKFLLEIANKGQLSGIKPADLVEKIKKLPLEIQIRLFENCKEENSPLNIFIQSDNTGFNKFLSGLKVKTLLEKIGDYLQEIHSSSDKEENGWTIVPK